MHILINILLVVASLIALLLIIALFSKKGYALSREITIHQPKSKVFDYIKLLKNQDHYNKWVMTDPNMKKEFRGTDGTPGFIYAWDGNKKAGAGEQEIKKLQEGQVIDNEIRFIRPFAGVAHTSMVTSVISDNQTLVKWHLSSQMKYPMNVMLLFVNIEKLLGKDMEISLRNLKKELEG